MSFHFPSWCCCCCFCNFADWYENKIEKVAKILLTSDKQRRENLWQLENFPHSSFSRNFTIHQNKRKVFKFFPITNFNLQIIVDSSTLTMKSATLSPLSNPLSIVVNFQSSTTLCWFLITRKTLKHKFSLYRHVDKFIDFPVFFSLRKFPSSGKREFCRQFSHERKREREKKNPWASYHTNTSEFIVIFTQNKFHKIEEIKWRKK